MRRLYAKFKGTKLSDGKTFDDQVLEDLAEFRKRGVATGAKIEEIQSAFLPEVQIKTSFSVLYSKFLNTFFRSFSVISGRAQVTLRPTRSPSFCSSSMSAILSLEYRITAHFALIVANSPTYIAGRPWAEGRPKLLRLISTPSASDAFFLIHRSRLRFVLASRVRSFS